VGSHLGRRSLFRPSLRRDRINRIISALANKVSSLARERAVAIGTRGISHEGLAGLTRSRASAAGGKGGARVEGMMRALLVRATGSFAAADDCGPGALIPDS
jgi:hypothetical protein